LKKFQKPLKEEFMTKKICSLFLVVAIIAGLTLLADGLGVSGKAYATPDWGQNCSACHGSKSKESKSWAKMTKGFTTDFMAQECGGFSTTGSNPFFILEPGHQLVLEDDAGTRLVITVLNKTKTVDGVETRVVEENETLNGAQVEISKNYFAVCNRTNSVHYFGEDVDIFNPDGTVSHDGAWLAGQPVAPGSSIIAQAGIIMPGTILLGGKYFQEIAPGVAMDRAEIKSMTEVVETQAGTFENCLKTFETTPLDKKAKDFKFYAPGIGLVKDGDLTLKEVVPAP
jgi:hypothetical protein